MNKPISNVNTSTLPKLSVIICTHNPKNHIFCSVLDAIKTQTLSPNYWELIIIDNLSEIPISTQFDISWHPNSSIYLEQKLGLSHARLRGVKESKASLVVFVDDDNILSENYLQVALEFHKTHPQVGSFGGKSLPEYESTPPTWFFETDINLGCQHFGDILYISDYRACDFQVLEYPKYAPLGTGMTITRDAFLEYINEIDNDPRRLNLGRKGNKLTSGEDNDIILTIIKKKYEIAYVPQLVVKHLIPSNRYSKDYLKKMAYESNRSWVKVLEVHNVNPWKKINPNTLLLRKIKKFLTIKPWKSDLNSIKYSAALGKFKGQSEI